MIKLNQNPFEYAQIQEQRYPFNPNQQAASQVPSHRMASLYKAKRVVVAKCQAVGSHYLYGPSSAYSDEYPMALTPFVPREEFTKFMGEINGQIEKYWPCTFTFIIAYACCILTCCLSLALPKCCLDDVVKFLHYVLERWNETFNPRGVFVDWRRSCAGSYIEFSVKDQIFSKVMERTQQLQQEAEKSEARTSEPQSIELAIQE